MLKRWYYEETLIKVFRVRSSEWQEAGVQMGANTLSAVSYLVKLAPFYWREFLLLIFRRNVSSSELSSHLGAERRGVAATWHNKVDSY